jgi:5-methylcytosine-specific restriction endonuclease McrA
VIRRSKQSKSAKFNRANVLLRDNSECQYCRVKLERKNFTFDHILPVSQGGKTNWKNIVACCVPCNQKKKDRTPYQSGMKLIREPYVPDSFEILNKSRANITWPEEWKDYIGDL